MTITKTSRALAVITAGAAFAAACSSDDDGAAQPEPPADEATTTAEANDETTTTAPEAVAAVSEEQLNGMLLKLDDMPTGWAEQPAQDDPVCGVEAAVGDLEAWVSASYAEDARLGPGISENLGVGVEGAGPDIYPQVLAEVEGCTGESDGVEFSTSPLNAPSVGDESAGFRTEFVDPATDQRVTTDSVVFRVGDLVGIVSGVDVFGDPGELLATYGPLAVQRIEELAGEAASAS